MLAELPDHRVGLVPGVNPDWASARALVVNLIDPAAAAGQAPAMEVASCVEGAYGLAISITAVLASPLGLEVHTDAALGENDSSATGFVPPAEFERLAHAFFASPQASVRGWNGR